MARNDLLLELVIKAVDLATQDIESVNAKVKELGRTLTQSEFSTVGEDMRAFGEAVKASTDPLAQATAKALALNTALVGVASLVAGRAYESAKSYESALADLAKVLDGGMEAAKGYGAQLNQTAQQFAQNGQELVASMANFVQAGYTAKEAFDLVTESVKLKIAGDLEAAQSSELLVSILKGFRAEASEAAGVVDMLNEVSNKYATDVKQLAIGMAALSPIAKTMGFSMQETAGLLTPIIEVYRSGSEAADALKTSLQQLSAKTEPVKAALASIGVSQTDLNGKLRDGKDIFLDVAKAFVGLSDAQKSYFAQELVGVEQAGRFGTVIQNLGGYLKVTDAAFNSTGSAAKEVATRLETAEAAGKRADESFRQLSVTIGTAFKPQIQALVSATGDLAAAFDRSIKAGDLSPLLNVLKPQIAAVENLVRAMANNLEAALAGVDWRPLVNGLKAVSGELGEAFAKLSEGMDLTTVDGLRDLLQAIINLLGNFSQFVAGAVDGLKPFIGALNTLFSAVSENSPELANLAGEISGLATSANQIIPVISKFGAAMFGAVGEIAELALKIGLLVAAMKLLSAAGIPVIGILGNLARAFFALNPAVAGAITALTGFPGLVTGMIAGVGALGYGIGTLIDRFTRWATGGQSVGTMVADLVDKLTGLNDRLTKNAPLEEQASQRAERLARAKQQAAAAAEQQAKAEEEAARQSEAHARIQEQKLKNHAAEQETIQRLTAQYAALGLIYDAATGQILRQGEATAQQQQQSRELGDALDKLGVSANFMANRITAGGAEIIAAFRGITQNAQATAAQIEAAFRAAIQSAETEAEVKKILAAYREWAEGAKTGAADVAAATEIATQKNRELKKSVEEVSPAIKALIAAGADEIEIKKTEAIQSGNFAEYLRLETEQRKKAEDATRANADASDEAADAKAREADASQQAADAQNAQSQAAHTASEEATRVAEKTAYAAKNFDQLSEKGQAALKAIGTGYQTAHGSIEQLNRAIMDETRALDGAAGAELAAVERLKKLQAAAAGVGPEADRAKEALANLARGGGAGIAGITQAGEQAISTLEGIKAAAEQAAQSLADMAEDFRRQMLQLQGDQTGLLEAEHEDNLRRLRELYEAAGDYGKDEYNRAVAQANKLHSLKLEQLREQEQEQRRRERDSASGTTEDLDKITEAAERTKSALSGVAGVDLSGLAGQARDLRRHFQGLNELL
jgi:TP901 family phage tail tape measure protein